ncbi:hypothetical protein EVAR_49536_1 [Eumeta japonica]|uniref:Uncharacterized protein n=1 Tax=Eumeta variegata TaxID=151549 RepID=A0A4C1XJZ1_EUMVA|nr:hypothetical protein EVAR_49536_1 [Eumeta japonica]
MHRSPCKLSRTRTLCGGGAAEREAAAARAAASRSSDNAFIISLFNEAPGRGTSRPPSYLAITMLNLIAAIVSDSGMKIHFGISCLGHGLLMELEGGHRNSVIKRRNPIEFGLV